MSDDKENDASLAPSHNRHLRTRSTNLVRRGLDDVAKMRPAEQTQEPEKDESFQFSETEIARQLKDFTQHLDQVEEQANSNGQWKTARANSPLYQQTTYEQRKANGLRAYEAFLRKGKDGIREHLNQIEMERQALQDHGEESTEFDNETYAEAQPTFIAGMSSLNTSGMSAADSLRALMRTLRDDFNFNSDRLAAMKPYIIRFIQDVEAGRIDISQKEANAKALDIDPDSDPWERLSRIADELMEDAEAEEARAESDNIPRPGNR